MTVYRVEHGLIFDDKFDELNMERWSIRSPSNFIVHTPFVEEEVEDGEEVKVNRTDGYLTLNHPTYDTVTSVMTDIPDNRTFLLQVEAEYSPSMVGDMGGIVVWKNAMEKVEFVETMDNTTLNNYSTWRTVKRDNMWTFFAKNSNGVWELFDSTICIDPHFIGVMLKGVNRSGFKPMTVNRVIACKGNFITVGNLTQGQVVNLVDVEENIVSTTTVPNGHSGISIELPTIPFNGKISIVGNTPLNSEIRELSSTEENVLIYGGDVFLKGTDLKVKWKNKLLSELDPTLLGSLKNDEITTKMILFNDNEYEEAENVRIKIAMYLDHFGWEWVDIAPDVGDAPGNFDDILLEVGHMRPLEEIPFWVKIVREYPETGAPVTSEMMKPTYFLLEVVND